MKFFVLIIPLFFSFKNAPAQLPDGLPNTKELIKQNRVLIKYVYSFKSKLDSVPTNIHTYDTLGNILSSKTVSANGGYSWVDTFIYDNNHYLVKHIGSSDSKIKTLGIYTTDANGKLIRYQIHNDDSSTINGISDYDENGRVISSVIYDDKGDSTKTNTFYNGSGLVTKFIASTKLYGTSIHTTDYDLSGKIIYRSIIDPESEIFTKYKYEPDGINYETITTVIYKNKKENKKMVNKGKRSYYSNGLAFEFFHFSNSNQVSWERAYYTYY